MKIARNKGKPPEKQVKCGRDEWIIRRAMGRDGKEVGALLDEAFAPSVYESGLVRALARSKRTTHSWVGEREGRLVAYLAYTTAYRDSRGIGFHLGPVAVRPENQGKGWGSRLIRETLALDPLRGRAVFVLGDPGYYQRFGFQRVRQPVCPFDQDNRHFMALRYEGNEAFVIGYEREFGMAESISK